MQMLGEKQSFKTTVFHRPAEILRANTAIAWKHLDTDDRNGHAWVGHNGVS